MLDLERLAAKPSPDPSAHVEWHDLENMLLTDLASRRGGSVRLRNSLAKGGPDARIRTVREYLDAGEAATPILMRDVRNFGRTTGTELNDLVSRALDVWDPSTGTFVGENVGPVGWDPDGERMRAWLFASFGDATVSEALQGQELSVRLDRAVHHSPFSDRRFVDVVADTPSAEVELLSIDNVGSRSVREFLQVVQRRVAARLVAGDDAPEPFDGSGASPVEKLGPEADLEEALGAALAELPERDSDVIRRRYGVARSGTETLEALGVTYDVTRERIRQIETRALGRIRVLLRNQDLPTALAARRDEIWASVCDGDAIPWQDIGSLRQRLPAHAALALDLCQRSVREWLDETALRLEFGWHRDRGDGSELARLATEVSSAVDRGVLPMALAGIVPPDRVHLARVAARLILGFNVEAGYVVRGRVGVRLGRAIHLHALLAREASPVGVDELLARYVERRPGDPCSTRDAAIVMEAAPHLFLEVQDDEWLAIGVGGDVPSEPFGGVAAQVQTSVVDPSEATLSRTLATLLAKMGPSRFVDIYEQAAAVLPPGRSPNSIGPTLLTQRDAFVRPVPGVYALREQVASTLQQPGSGASYLTNETQARLFALARRAGEPWGVFPLWIPAIEHRLCEWARLFASADCFRSLLAVASVAEWPVDQDLRAEWLHRVDLQGRFTLTAHLKPASYLLPELDRVLAACVHVASRSSLNWMAANRISGRRIDAHPGAALVAVMALVGAVDLPECDRRDWQLPHPAGARLGEVMAELTHELHRSGALSWHVGAGARLREGIRGAAPMAGAWIDVDRVAGMWDNGSIEVGRVVESAADAAERLMLERQRTLESRRREDTLRWLLSE